MNCEKYQDLLSDFVDGSLNPEDHNQVEAHLSACGVCSEARSDLDAIVIFCRENRGEYDAVPNERALWLRISNTIESELPVRARPEVGAGRGWLSRLLKQSWQLSFPQLAAAVSAIVIVVALGTVFGVRLIQNQGTPTPTASNSATVEERYRQQQQVIAYWNQRVELNKARWSPQMRETFDRNMGVIDTAVNDSMRQLTQNPHDGVSEDILNAALNDKVELLKEFADL